VAHRTWTWTREEDALDMDKGGSEDHVNRIIPDVIHGHNIGAVLRGSSYLCLWQEIEIRAMMTLRTLAHSSPL
jgi:hypothetical protein